MMNGPGEQPSAADGVQLRFDTNATANEGVLQEVQRFFGEVRTLEAELQHQVPIFQDGVRGSYYVKCTLPAAEVEKSVDLNARLESSADTAFRANRELLLKHSTYRRMVADAAKGREFNDIIVEYSKNYTPEKPLKVWGGQHRSKAIVECSGHPGANRCHGFRVYFCLDKKQRAELALVSNTLMGVSNDLFDRLQEDTLVGGKIRKWCWDTGLLPEGTDFPDKRSGSELMTVKMARTFIVNFYEGKSAGAAIQELELENRYYQPVLCEAGTPDLDPRYQDLIDRPGDSVWTDPLLLASAKAFAQLQRAQYDAAKKYKDLNIKGFRNKAMVESVLAGWSYVAGLLQAFPQRLQNHFEIPRTTKKIRDPLNAKGMSEFSHDVDGATYRGLGTRSSIKDRIRMAQVFLVRSSTPRQPLTDDIISEAVEAVVSKQSEEKRARLRRKRSGGV